MTHQTHSVLLCNKYFTVRGGADRVFFDTMALLESRGHRVIPFSVQSPDTEPTPYARYFAPSPRWASPRRDGVAERLAGFAQGVYNHEVAEAVRRVIREERPDIVHVHNLHYELTPAVLRAAHEAGIPVVMTIHDVRVLCPNGYMYTKGAVCERCQGGHYYHAVLQRCLRSSLQGSLLGAASAYFADLLGVWRNDVDLYLTPSRFHQQKYVAAGFPAERFVHLPNFVDASRYRPASEPGRYLLFLGYLVRQKGILTLIDAMRQLTDVPLRIVGAGPALDEARNRTDRYGLINVSFEGFKSGDALWDTIRGALAVVLPSECYENAPMTILESYALGKPVVGARSGGIPETILDGETGYLFDPGDDDRLADRLQAIVAAPAEAHRMGQRGRTRLEAEHSPEQHYERLAAAYQVAADRHQQCSRTER